VKALLFLFGGVALAACHGNLPEVPKQSSIARSLKQGMTERQVMAAAGNRVPNSVIIRICGDETPSPFPCRIFIYEGGVRAGVYEPKLSIVFEDFGGTWKVGQWL
jgi:hypothetical protein